MKLPDYRKDLEHLNMLRRRMVQKLVDGEMDEEATIPQLLNAHMNVFKMLALEIDLRKEIEEPTTNVGSAVKKYERYFASTNDRSGSEGYARSNARTKPRLVSTDDDGLDSGESLDS